MSLLIAAALTLVTAPLIWLAIRALKPFCQNAAEEAALWRAGVFLSALPLPMALLVDFLPPLKLNGVIERFLPSQPPIGEDTGSAFVPATTLASTERSDEPLEIAGDLFPSLPYFDWLSAFGGVVIAALIAGMVFTSVRLFWRHWTLRQLLSLCPPLGNGFAKNRLKAACDRQGFERLPKMKHLEGDISPFVAGVRQPTLVLTDTVLKLDEQAFDYVCGHELAHIRRQDIVWRLGEDLVGCVLWFNPFVKQLRTEAYEACERACDADVLNWAPRKAYAQTLLSLFRSGRVPDAALAFPPNQKRSAEMRLKSILSHEPGQRRSGGSRLMTGLIAGVAAPIIIVQACAASMAAESVSANEPVILLSGNSGIEETNSYDNASELFGGRTVSDVSESEIEQERAAIQREREAIHDQYLAIEDQFRDFEYALEDDLKDREIALEDQELALEEQLELLEEQLEAQLEGQIAQLAEQAEAFEEQFELLEDAYENGDLTDQEFRIQSRVIEKSHAQVERQAEQIERTVEREMAQREREIERQARELERAYDAYERELEKSLVSRGHAIKQQARELERRDEALERREEQLDRLEQEFWERKANQLANPPAPPVVQERQFWPIIEFQKAPPPPETVWPTQLSVPNEILPTLNYEPLTHPVVIHEKVRVSSSFGERFFKGEKKYHAGTDVVAPLGTAILAAGDGEVVKVTTPESTPGYGHAVVVEHGDGVRTLYGNLEAATVEIGQKVSAGDEVGTLGNSGVFSTGPHLHFEIRLRQSTLLERIQDDGTVETEKVELSREFDAEAFEGFELYRRII